MRAYTMERQCIHSNNYTRPSLLQSYLILFVCGRGSNAKLRYLVPLFLRESVKSLLSFSLLEIDAASLAARQTPCRSLTSGSNWGVAPTCSSANDGLLGWSPSASAQEQRKPRREHRSGGVAVFLGLPSRGAGSEPYSGGIPGQECEHAQPARPGQGPGATRPARRVRPARALAARALPLPLRRVYPR